MLSRKVRKEILALFILAIAAVGMHAYVFQSGSPLITRGTDATVQLLFFKYMLHSLFTDDHFFWSWSYGLGGDIFGQFNYYYSASPFLWLLLFFDIDTLTDVAGWVYKSSIIKHFAAMAGVYVLLKYHNRSFTASLVGALMYGGTILFAFNSLQFDFMLDPYIWLPIAVLSLDLYVDKKRAWPLILSVALMTASNFYFGFISSVYLICYAILKYFEVEKNASIKDFIGYGLRTSIVYLIGLGISAFAFLPAVYQFLHTDRLQRDYAIPFLFDIEHYENALLFLFFSFRSAHPITYSIGLPILAFVLLLSSFTIRSASLKHKKIFLGVFFLLFCFPYTYSFFNGMSAMQTRWLYLFSFTICFITPFFLDEMKFMKNKHLLTGGTLFLLIYLVWKSQGISHDVAVYNYILLGIGILSILFLILFLKRKHWVLSALLVGAVAVNGMLQHYFYYNEFLGTAGIQKEVNRTYLSSISFDNREALSIFEEIERSDPGFYRIIWDHPKVEYNTPMYYGYKGNSAYQSLLSGNVHQFFKEDYNILQFDSMSMFKNYDQRAYLESVTANKYYIVDKNAMHIPFGYVKRWETANWDIYENQHFLPIGFHYSQWITEEEFRKLNPAEKDQLLLQAAVVKDELSVGEHFDVKKLSTQTLHQGVENVIFKNIEGSGRNEYNALLENGSELIIPIENPDENGEILVEIDIEELDGKSFTLTLNGKTLEKRPNHLTWSYPKTNFVINAGWNYEEDEIRIELSNGHYRINDLHVYFNSYENLVERVDDLRQTGLKNLNYTEESISGEIIAAEDGIFYLSVPYSKGWNVRIDGAEVEHIEVNHTFIGIPLEKGTYKLEMNYVTPFFKEGFLVSILSIICGALLSLWRRKNGKSSKDSIVKG